MLMMSGLQGQTPYGLIVFGEGEMMFHSQGGFRSKCLFQWGPNTKISPKPIRTYRKASSSKDNVSLPNVAH